MTMTDEKTKQKAIEAAADIFGINTYYIFIYLGFDYHGGGVGSWSGTP